MHIISSQICTIFSYQKWTLYPLPGKHIISSSQKCTLYPLLKNSPYIIFSILYLLHRNSQFILYYKYAHYILFQEKNNLFYSYIIFSDKENISTSQKYTLYTLLRSAHYIISDIHYTLFSEMHIISTCHKYTLYPLLSTTSSFQKQTLYQLHRNIHYILYSEMHITHTHIPLHRNTHNNYFQIKTIYPLLRNTVYIH